MKKQKAKPDIIAVANAAQVSAATVSRAFNHPETVKPTTRKRIEEAVQELGYIRNRAAQVMYGRRSGTIGLVAPTVNNVIFSELIQALTEAIDAAGFTLVIASHGYDLQHEHQLTRKLLEHRVDGIALIGLDHLDCVYRLIEQQGLPAISIWNFDEAARIPCVGAKNRDAGRIAAQHLLDRGHTQIGAVFPQMAENDRARNRLLGGLEAFEHRGVGVPERWRIESPYDLQKAKRACLGLFGQPDRPTALLCGNDVIAQGAIYAAQQSGLSIPGDVAIMGIGDFPGSAEIVPALSTVRIPARRIGSAAGKELIAAVDSGGETPPASKRFHPRLVARETT